MASSGADWKHKRAVAIRVQRLIEARFPSFSSFRRQYPSLAETARGWVPPQRLWREKPDGKAVRQVDWAAVHLPSPGPLAAFCDLFEANAEYITAGTGPRYRQQSREPAALEADVAAAVLRGLRATHPAVPMDSQIDVPRIIADAVARCAQDADAWARFDEEFAGVIAPLNAAIEAVLRVIPGTLNPRAPQLHEAREVLDALMDQREAWVESWKGRFHIPDFKYLRVTRLTGGPPARRVRLKRQVREAETALETTLLKHSRRKRSGQPTPARMCGPMPPRHSQREEQ